MAGRRLSQVSAAERAAAEEQLGSLFLKYAKGNNAVDKASLQQMAVESNLLDKRTTSNDIDLIFQKVKVGKKDTLNKERFMETIRQIAIKKEVEYVQVLSAGTRAQMELEAVKNQSSLAIDAEQMTVKQIREILKQACVNYADCYEKRDLVDRMTSTVGAPRVTGADALRACATKVLESSKSMEFEVTYETRRSLGISLERANEWGVCKIGPPEVDIGSVLIRVNKTSVLLKSYSDAMDTLRQSSWPLTMRFRKAVCKEGYLYKRSRGMKHSARNWKKRYFILENGILNYYTKPPSQGGEIKGQYALENDPGSQTMVTIAPAAAMNKDEAGIMLVKGDDRLIMKDDSNNFGELMDWGGKLYYAVAMANGGNPEMMNYEAQSLELEEAEVAHQRWIEEQALMKKKHEEYLEAMHAGLDAEHANEQSTAEAQRAQEMQAEMQALEAKQRAEADALAREQEEQKNKRESGITAQARQQEEAEAAAAAAAAAAEVAEIEEAMREAAVSAAMEGPDEAEAPQVSTDEKAAEAEAAAAVEDEDDDEEADTIIKSVEEMAEEAKKKADEALAVATPKQKKRMSMLPQPAAAAAAAPAEESVPTSTVIKTGNKEFNYETDIGWFNM
jgi:hypothetical protein